MLETSPQPPAPVGKKSAGYKAERLRGMKDARAQIEVLKVKWPAVFNAPENIRPLAGSVLPQITTALGWTYAYGRGVFQIWKTRRAYCRAVLRYSVRINLDGSPSAETVSDEVRKMAQAQLDLWAAREAKKRTHELTKANTQAAL
jgi:sRNA-binding protein